MFYINSMVFYFLNSTSYFSIPLTAYCSLITAYWSLSPKPLQASSPAPSNLSAGISF
jgi:hypothetical protein